MNYIEFCEKVKHVKQDFISEDYTVSITMVEKLNGLTLQSLVILKNEENIAPNIYLESYYQEFLEGKPIDTISLDIITLYYRTDKRTDLSCDSLMEFNLAKDKIYFKLVNYNRNKDLLNNIPHKKWMDLAIIFSVLVKKDTMGIGSFLIKQDLLNRWDVPLETIYQLAMVNTPLLFGFNVRSMNEIIKEMVLGQFTDINEDDNSSILMDLFMPDNTITSPGKKEMYVATNTLGINGATWLLYHNELHNFSSQMGTDFYILPSSIHEVILVPSSEIIPKDELLKMVMEVNLTHVALQEILSDNVHFFDHKQNTIQPLF